MAKRKTEPVRKPSPPRPSPAKAPESPIDARVTLLTDHDLYLFNECSHFRLYGKLGAHLRSFEGVSGAHFAVWAPSAVQVFVVGDFNNWDKTSHPLRPRQQSG